MHAAAGDTVPANFLARPIFIPGQPRPFRPAVTGAGGLGWQLAGCDWRAGGWGGCDWYDIVCGQRFAKELGSEQALVALWR